MAIEIKAPTFPESITEGSIAVWHVGIGEPVRRDALLVDIETDKVVIEVVAPDSGQLTSIVKAEGDTVESEEVIGYFEGGLVEAATGDGEAEHEEEAGSEPALPAGEPAASPAARKLAQETGIDVGSVTGTGKSGRITKEDVSRAVQNRAAPGPGSAEALPAVEADPVPEGERVDRRVPMTRLRASVARRLVEAQQTAAMLTTFNEVDMQPIMTMRRRYQQEFQERHNGTRLGFMSFFVRASVEALKRFPSVNASIDGDDIVYHGYFDIGVAVSSERGLVVPVIRDADALGLAQIEDLVIEYGEKAQTGKLSIDEMSGGTFTVSNGGVFGSLMSTPILNPPQTGILGMHKIQERPVVVDGEIVVRPMMYLALSYDHRLIDGKEAVQFLVTVKNLIEDPARILLEL